MATLRKVVAHVRGGKLLKGNLITANNEDVDTLALQGTIILPDTLPLRIAQTNETVNVPLDSLKALFFVKSWEGRDKPDEIRNFQATTPMQGVWARIEFYDNEITEGVIRNSQDFVTGSGFFMKPPDPRSNNDLVYVVKSSLKNFHVRGVRYA